MVIKNDTLVARAEEPRGLLKGGGDAQVLKLRFAGFT
jgi:hypothetical protein